MKRFLYMLFIFLAPFSLLLIPVAGLIYFKEIFIDCTKIALKNEKYVFGLAYTEVGRQFKFANLNSRERFEIVALGSSRVMQFRSNMFTHSFYNAGGVTQSYLEFESFLKAIPQNKLPHYLIIGLDQWMFNASYQDNYVKDQLPVVWSDFSAINSGIPQKVEFFMEDYKNEKFFLKAYNGFSRYGVNALVEMNGFRNDGSYFYTTIMRKLLQKDTTFHDFQYRTTLDRIAKGCCRFNYGDSIDIRALSSLNSLLYFCKENSIEVVAFLPPFATTILDTVTHNKNFKYLKDIFPSIRPLFTKYGFEVYDSHQMKSVIENNDHEMIDGYHGGEVIYTKILIEMLESGSVLNNVSNLKKLKLDLRQAKNSYLVYDY